jgi:hypothetical protein
LRAFGILAITQVRCRGRIPGGRFSIGVFRI